MTPSQTIHLLTIRGTLAPSTLDAARAVHNETAGAPPNVAAARSLGDLSHAVFVPLGPPPAKGAGELLIIDLWNDAAGLARFFENPDVQKGGGAIFSSRDPIVWAPAEGFLRVDLPSPAGRNDRFVGLLRGTVRSKAVARKILDGTALSHLNDARKLGLLSHATYFRAGPPGEKESLEMISVETWYDGEGMGKYYGDESHMPDIGEMLVGPPDVSVWQRPPGAWVEW